MATAEDLLEEMLTAQLDLVRAKKGSEKESKLEERLALLEERFAEKPKDERTEALEELSDEEWDLVRAHRAGTAKTKEADDVVEDTPPPEPKERKTRPGRRSGVAYHFVTDDSGHVQAVDIPTIYSGPDEPDEVDLPDDVAA